MLNNKHIRIMAMATVGLLVAGFLIFWYFVQPRTVLYALDAETGRVLWSADLGRSEASDPVAAAGRVFIDIGLDQRHPKKPGASDVIPWKLAAFDAATGRRLWQLEPESGKYNSEVVEHQPLAAADVVVDDIDSSTLAVFDAASSAQRYTITRVVAWGQSRPGTDISAAISAGRLVALRQAGPETLNSDALQAYDLQTGTLLWSTDLASYTGENALSPVNPNLLIASKNQVYLTDFYTDNVYQTNPFNTQVYDLTSGELMFSLDHNCELVKLHGSTLYCMLAGFLGAYDAKTGAQRWNLNSHSAEILFKSLAAQDDAVYVTRVDYNESYMPVEMWLQQVDASEGQVLWETRLWDGAFSSRPIFYTRPVASAESVFSIERLGGHKQLVALSAVDGAPQWRFSLHSGWSFSPAYDDNRIFIVDEALRWRHWLASINPAWY